MTCTAGSGSLQPMATDQPLRPTKSYALTMERKLVGLGNLKGISVARGNIIAGSRVRSIRVRTEKWNATIRCWDRVWSGQVFNDGKVRNETAERIIEAAEFMSKQG